MHRTRSCAIVLLTALIGTLAWILGTDVSRSLASLAQAPGSYRALTRIRIRESPDVKSQPTGATVEPGEVFSAVEVLASQTPDGIGYLRLADRNGWVFDTGIGGAWLGKAILERVEVEVVPAPGTVAPSIVATPAYDVTPTDATAAEAPAVDVLEPVVALATAPVETMRLPGNMLGTGYELTRLEAEGLQQPLTFLLSTAFPKNAVTTRANELLQSTAATSKFKGGWLSQTAAAENKVDIKGIRFLGTGGRIDDLKDCEILDFPQSQLLAQLGVEVHGILGQPFFELYDWDLDRYRQRAQLYAPGLASSQGFYSTVKHLPGIALPSGNLGVVLRSSVYEEDGSQREVNFVGLVDTGAAHTILNWEAAKLLGYTGPDDPRLFGATKVLGASEKGEAEEMPVVLMRLSLGGIPAGVKPMLLSLTQEEFNADGGKGWYFEEETLRGGDGCLACGAVNVAIGNPLGLSVLGDGAVGPFKGAGAIIGQDLLFQAERVVINMKDKQLWVEAGDIRDDTEM
mmetsp:Transcript_99712/g.197740  ORF Transcript_99712/g.197740 Transcript_99712/m.197740 type:complete len:514 (-) Transcript_99712:54-1595(-)|eukprot:CAMPEP_0172724050 /NCGR_PEP_ID=MMETSP1074-20121228/85074_1 /TAXON_ID=2916 /ORGANISM="Ceratium fusus, Strain PA161109" /LENGTH=513 /DNA_ID=CAMNT_0013550411 /DNA_START=121 /DNA_END=1662 /DNA_ORIENTATION=+